MEITRNGKTFSVDGLGAVLVILVFAVLALFVPAIIFAVAGNKTGVVGSLVAVGLILLGLLVMGAFAAGAAYNRSSTERGAGIVLTALQFDNKADAAMMANRTRVFTEGVRAAHKLQQPDMPNLPLPSQGMDWMAPVELLEHGEDVNTYLEG